MHASSAKRLLEDSSSDSSDTDNDSDNEQSTSATRAPTRAPSTTRSASVREGNTRKRTKLDDMASMFQESSKRLSEEISLSSERIANTMVSVVQRAVEAFLKEAKTLLGAEESVSYTRIRPILKALRDQEEASVYLALLEGDVEFRKAWALEKLEDDIF